MENGNNSQSYRKRPDGLTSVCGPVFERNPGRRCGFGQYQIGHKTNDLETVFSGSLQIEGAGNVYKN